MRHPADFLLKYWIIREPGISDPQLQKILEDCHHLTADPLNFAFLRQELQDPPQPQAFNPTNRLHRASMQYLRDKQVFEMFYPNQPMLDAMDILFKDDFRRRQVEQVILARLDYKTLSKKLNQKYGWKLSEKVFELYYHYFWNRELLSFDEWGRYLMARSAMYDRYMGLLQGTPELAYFHLRLDANIESKRMIQRAQQIAYFALEELQQIPGVRIDKLKGISVLTHAINECNTSMATSDMAMAGVLKQFEQFRMQHPESQIPDIKQLAPAGNFTGSGLEKLDELDKEKVH